MRFISGKRTTIWLAAITAFLSTTTLTPAARAQVELKLSFVKGQVAEYRMITDQDVTQSIAGAAQKIKQKTGMGMKYETLKLNDDGSADLSLTYTWAMVEMQSTMMSFKYDSDKPEGDPPAPAAGMAALLGATFELTMLPDGGVTSVRGVDEMVDKMTARLKVPPAMKPMMVQQLKQQFNNEALKEMMTQMTGLYPAKPVSVGESWTKTTEGSAIMPIRLVNKFTLKSVEDGKAKVDTSSDIKSDDNAEAKGAGQNAKFNLKGSQTGTIELDAKTGWIINTDVTQAMSGSVTMDLGGNKMEMPMEIKSKATFIKQ
ncbi:MAG: hypothetical protein GC159_15135 [Phycisphaera sp.]|nr:hypothetical protein [Phycisphaera sp.]